jgi:hypothetical protein
MVRGLELERELVQASEQGWMMAAETPSSVR